MSVSTRIIEQQQGEISRILKPLLPMTGSRVALVDFPNHGNVGDSAIWLGEQIFLNKNGFQGKVYTCEIGTYSKAHLAGFIGDGTIFLHGGGNLGDLYPKHQLFREQVIRDFPGNSIIQMPQSICFRDEANLGRACEVYSRHPDLLLLVRDRNSQKIAETKLLARTYLCPDMAFNLGPVSLPDKATIPCLWLTRSDGEAQFSDDRMPRDGLWMSDWLNDELTDTTRADAILRYLYANNVNAGRRDEIRQEMTGIYPQISQERVLRGCGLLVRAHSVITERLHGHIFCLLLGIPHYVLDTRYAKICNYIESWGYDSPLVRICDTADEALQHALA